MTMEVHMQVHEIMTKELVTATPDTPVTEIAKLLVQHRIGAIPVLAGDGRLVGLVSQTDLAHRSETGTEKRRKWWLEMFADADVRAREYVKSHGLKAADVMTRGINSVSHDASLAEVADVLDTHRVRQVPVMRDGKMIGIISRGDLVRALAELTATAPVQRPANGQLQRLIWEHIRAESWLQSAFLNLAVKDGVVELYGAVDSPDQRRALIVLVSRVPGVQNVEDKLTIMPKVMAA
jgi:CBS domain-containing protein